jgi:signal-transduction protein with cAMP-binding, CBS, and nucleotidyltransferase domain
MPCAPEVLRQVPLFKLLDDDEMGVLAGQVDLKTFAPRQRIYRIGDPGERFGFLAARRRTSCCAY